MTSMTQEELADLLALSQASVSRLYRTGVLRAEADGTFGLENVRRYIEFLRRDEPTKAARRDLVLQQIADRRLRTKAVLGRTLTEAEAQEFIDSTWLAHLQAWRLVAASFYRAVGHMLDDERARVVAGKFEQEACGWHAEALQTEVAALETEIALRGAATPDRGASN